MKPLDEIMELLSLAYHAGFIGFTDNGELIPLIDIFSQHANYSFPSMPHELHLSCNTIYPVDCRENGSCPYCHEHLLETTVIRYQVHKGIKQ